VGDWPDLTEDEEAAADALRAALKAFRSKLQLPQ
jgi:hypothetical protein